MPTNRDIDELDQADDNDDTHPGLVRRLTKVGRVQTRLNARLDVITTKLGNPPDPVKPDLIAALNEIKTQTQATIAKTDALMAQLSPR